MRSHRKFNNLMYSLLCVLFVLLGFAAYAFILYLFRLNSDTANRVIADIVLSVLYTINQWRHHK